ncbi:MAG: ABC transporter substrate-binding protein [Chloroflexota bacterium]
MTDALLKALCAYVPRDRVEHILHPDRPMPDDGVALIADISGFTPLTEALTHGLSADHGAEELTRALSDVFTPLIEEVHAFRGSVMKFGGDALIVWYPREKAVRRAAVIRRAITSAWRMQQAIQVHGKVPTPIGTVTLQMKVGLTYGSVKRFNLGLPAYGYEDILGGETLDRMADAEHHAEPGDIMLDSATLAYLPEAIEVAEWREEFAAIDQVLAPAKPKPWPELHYPQAQITALIEQMRAYVPQQVYELLAMGQSTVAELKPVVSLFVQFHGIDYDHDPQVGQKLQTYFSTAQTIAVRYGGRVNRLITGDKGSLIHVIFGAPRNVEEQERRAIRCALDLQKECGGLSAITMQRIGVTLGRVFAGPIGSPNRHDYTTMGDSINLSARLMQNAADDQVLIEQSIRDQLDETFVIDDLGEIMVKGKSAPISIYAAVDVHSQSRRGSQKQAMPIFGRDDELNAISQHLIELAQGQGGVVTLVGEVGMGKTHMLTLLRAKFAAQPILEIDWAEGMCLAYGQTLSGYLFIDLLRDLMHLPPGANSTETLDHLINFCQQIFGEERLEATFPYLARFMGLPLEDAFAQRVEGLSGESLRWQVFEVIREMIARIVENRPLVLTLDDLQWADPTSMQLLEDLLPLAAERKLVFLLALRPDRDSSAWALTEILRTKGLSVMSLPSLKETTTSTFSAVSTEGAGTILPHLNLVLGPLNRSSASTLIDHFAPNLPERMIDYLVDKGGGNPLYLVEIIRTLEAQGILADDIDPANIDLGALDLPNSVQGLLLAQIDRLTTEARHTLQMASVIGRSFLYRVLDQLADGKRDLDQQLQRLEEYDYISEDDPTDHGLAYLFRHALIQESTYATIIHDRRRSYHRHVAKALEQLFTLELSEQAGLLAYHYEQAEDIDQAITYHLQAADQARLIWANEEAEMLYQKVLKLFDLQEEVGQEPDLDRRAKTYLKLGQVYSNILDFQNAQFYYDQAFDLLDQTERMLETHDQHMQLKDERRVIKLGIGSFGPSTIDPALIELSDVTEIIKDIFEGLVELDSELNVIPALARRWQVDHSGYNYRFTLRSGLKWSDGQPLTAHDFVYAWRRNLSPQTKAGLAHQLFIIDGAEDYNMGENIDATHIAVEALDDTQLAIKLKTPTSYFPYLLTNPITFPQPKHKNGNQQNDKKSIVCNGPFMITSWNDKHEIHLARNRHFRGYNPGNLDAVILRFVDPNIAEYQKGSIDWCRVENRSTIPSRYLQEISLIQYLTTFLLGFACNTFPFNIGDIRRAFSHAIDQKALTKQVWSNTQKPAVGGIIPPGMIGHSPEIGLNFNPEYARELLKQSGISLKKDLPKIRLAAPQWFGDTPSFLQQTWQAHLGVHVEVVENIAIEDALEKFGQGDIQLILLGWGGSQCV